MYRQLLDDLNERFNSLEEGSRNMVGQVRDSNVLYNLNLPENLGQTVSSTADSEGMVWILIYVGNLNPRRL